MRIEEQVKLGFKDVLIRPKRSTLKSRAEVSLEREFVFKHSQIKWQGIPIISANMDTVGTFSMAKALQKNSMITVLKKHYNHLDYQRFFTEVGDTSFDNYLALSMGISELDFEKTSVLIKANPRIKIICIDVANGYTETFVDAVKRTRDLYPNMAIFAGNVVTGEMVEELILSGADVVKVGIGPGSVCTTRVKTGVGYPQLSAIIECADAAHGLAGQVISDGGCTRPGDVAKAFGAGADFVMIGGMFAGHDECDGAIKGEEPNKYMEFYGMSSSHAMEKHDGHVPDYRAAEGKLVQVPYKGPVSETVRDILGGVRSTCTYVGASRLKELSKRTTFIRVAEQENQIFSD